MARATIIYGTTTGNTELLAGYIAQGMNAAGVDVTVMDVIDVDVSELQDYDIILLGSSTWGEGELQDDFQGFYEEMEGLSLNGKRAAAFGPGDSNYENFCTAVDMLEDRLRECRATILTPGLKIDGDVVAAEKQAVEWGKQAVASVKT